MCLVSTSNTCAEVNSKQFETMNTFKRELQERLMSAFNNGAFSIHDFGNNFSLISFNVNYAFDHYLVHLKTISLNLHLSDCVTIAVIDCVVLEIIQYENDGFMSLHVMRTYHM